MTIETRLINGVSGDPSVYGFFPKTGDAVLFDLGSIDNLSNKDLLRVRTVLISHTHIDHFIGFDRLLRVNIPHGRIVEICGPKNITENVRGKLKGYTWNLLEPGQIRFVVHEISSEGEVSSSILESDNDFEPKAHKREKPKLSSGDPSLPSSPATFVTELSDGTRVEATVLDHGTPSVCYSLQSPCRYSVKDGALETLSASPGAWIRELQIALSDKDHGKEFEVGGKTYSAIELGALLFDSEAPKTVGYASDLIFSKENLERIGSLMQGVKTLVCESNFSSEDRERARSSLHLTTRQAALIAASVRAQTFQPFHISNIYSGEIDKIVDEALKYFKKFLDLSDKELESEAKSELIKRN